MQLGVTVWRSARPSAWVPRGKTYQQAISKGNTRERRSRRWRWGRREMLPRMLDPYALLFRLVLSRPHKWVERDGVPRPAPNLLYWAIWYEDADRAVAQDEIGEVRVSTVFLGTDHNFGPGEPILYETMIFGGKFDEHQWRYSTRAEAYAGHLQVVEMVRAAGLAS